MGKPQESSGSAADKPARKKFTKSLDPNRPSFKANARPQPQPQTTSVSSASASSAAHRDQLPAAATRLIRGVEMPVSADGMTADKLTANQKNVVKRGCQTMFGYKHRDQHKLKTIDAAAGELADLMKLVKQRKAAAAALKNAK